VDADDAAETARADRLRQSSPSDQLVRQVRPNIPRGGDVRMSGWRRYAYPDAYLITHDA
jgi:hypothetical protein